MVLTMVDPKVAMTAGPMEGKMAELWVMKKVVLRAKKTVALLVSMKVDLWEMTSVAQ